MEVKQATLCDIHTQGQPKTAAQNLLLLLLLLVLGPCRRLLLHRCHADRLSSSNLHDNRLEGGRPDRNLGQRPDRNLGLNIGQCQRLCRDGALQPSLGRRVGGASLALLGRQGRRGACVVVGSRQTESGRDTQAKISPGTFACA